MDRRGSDPDIESQVSDRKPPGLAPGADPVSNLCIHTLCLDVLSKEVKNHEATAHDIEIIVSQKQRRPEGPARAVSAQWKSDRLADMKRLGVSKAELSRRCHVTTATITNLFKDDSIQSRIVDAVHAALGLPPPREAAAAAGTAEFLSKMEQLSPSITEADQELVLAFATRMSRK